MKHGIEIIKVGTRILVSAVAPIRVIIDINVDQDFAYYTPGLKISKNSVNICNEQFRTSKYYYTKFIDIAIKDTIVCSFINENLIMDINCGDEIVFTFNRRGEMI